MMPLEVSENCEAVNFFLNFLEIFLIKILSIFANEF